MSKRIAAFLLATSAFIGPADSASLLEKNFWLSGPRYEGRLPACDDAFALGKIQSNFAQKEHRFWNSPLHITAFENIHETAYSPWATDTIPRRFCSAIANVSDGVRRPVHYSISEDLGIIGATFGVEWCVVGIDRNWAYSPACRMARP